MRKFQKLGGMLLTSCMMLSLMACGSKANAASSEQISTSKVITAGTAKENKDLETNGPEEKAAETTAPETAEADKTETPETAGKVLVAYYSASGNTERVAKDIASAAGGDLFQITPAEPYTSSDLDWTDKSSRVNHEHDDESLRDVTLVTTDVENWAEYDTVFVGYPIWWGIAAWPVNNFVKNNDFTGKTVIPFATSSSSGIGESGKLLKEMAGSGDWKDGQRFGSGADTSEVASWVSTLGLAK